MEIGQRGQIRQIEQTSQVNQKQLIEHIWRIERI